MKRGREFEYRSSGRDRGGWRMLLPELSPARFDWLILFLALVLIGTGLAFVQACFDANLSFRPESFGEGDPFDKHLQTLGVSLPVFAIGLYVRPVWLRRNAYLVYGLGLFLLVLVPFIGIELNNARRWLDTPVGFNLQPSEVMKVALIITLARALYRNHLETLSSWVRPALLVLVPMALIVTQPDLGTTLTIPPVTLGMLHLAGARGRTILGLVLVGGLLAWGAWSAGLVKEYQQRRVETWVESFDPDMVIEERNGAAFHTFNSRTAIGNGGLRGKGLGRGVANRAGHLPMKESDSIWSVISEELGLIGSGAVLLTYALFSMLILRAAGEVRDRFCRLVVGGVGLYFGAHFFIHVGVNIGLLPLTGLTLPLFSTGGSSILTSFGALGLVLGLTARRTAALDADSYR